MGDVSAAIAGFIAREISLAREDISTAVTSREWFLGRVVNEIGRRKNQPQLYAPDPLIGFGSYFKRTKVTDVDEFDVLLAIDTNGGIFNRGGSTVGTGLGVASPNPLLSGAFHKSDGSGVSPARLLNWLKDVAGTVATSFGGETPERDGQAITACIKTHNLKIDLVPAAIMARPNGETFFVIPKGDSGGNWIQTQPRNDIALLNQVAKGKERFRDVIRLCKFVKARYNFKVSSFAIESAIVHYGSTNIWLPSALAYNLTGAMSHLASAFRLGVIADPFEPAVNMVEGVDSLSWYAERVERIIVGLKALQLEPDQSRVVSGVARLLKNEW